ncbi:MAG: ribosome maturation factor RimP [Lachnospiraceae bacterium]|nr:ribosome maturation factor RimP [Lachnospiraceae bacterium]
MSRREEYEKLTEDLVLPILTDLKLELWDVEYVKEGKDYYLRVYIDKEGGVNIDDCVDVSRRLSDLLDQKDPISDAYTLEVSSPGLGRALKKDKELERSIGREVEIKLYKQINKKKEFKGKLKGYDASSISIICGDEDICFERSDVAGIKLAIDF